MLKQSNKNKSAPLFSYRIEGYSDDVLIVNEQEFYANGKQDLIKATFTDGTYSGQVRATLYSDDMWGVAIVPHPEGSPLPIGEYSLSVDKYTTVIIIKSPKELTFSGYQGETE